MYTALAKKPGEKMLFTREATTLNDIRVREGGSDI
jgi:hypothetical protein